MTSDDRTPERLLLIGCTAFKGLDCFAWADAARPNIPDYDLVVASVPHITQEFLRDLDIDVFSHIRKALVKFLHSGGKLVILLSPVINTKRPEKHPEWVSSLDWCPIKFATPEEAGRSIVHKWGMYEAYLARMSKWSFYITVPNTFLSRELTNFYGMHDTRYSAPLSPYIENRYGQTLAGQTCVEVRKARRSRDRWSNIRGEKYLEDPDEMTGDIVVLPLIDGVTPEEALLAILKKEVGYSLESPAPDWTQEIEVPFVSELEKKIVTAQDSIIEKEAEISELAAQVADLTAFRRLLYSTGTELEDIVKRSFELLGANVSPAKYSQEEYILEVEGTEYLMEVKGVSKSVSLTHLRQLNDYLLKFQEDTGKECKGILLGNAWRNSPPTMRNSEDTPEFPDNVVRRAEQWGITLLSSRSLFNAVLTALRSTGERHAMLSTIVEAKGVVEI